MTINKVKITTKVGSKTYLVNRDAETMAKLMKKSELKFNFSFLQKSLHEGVALLINNEVRYQFVIPNEVINAIIAVDPEFTADFEFKRLESGEQPVCRYDIDTAMLAFIKLSDKEFSYSLDKEVEDFNAYLGESKIGSFMYD